MTTRRYFFKQLFGQIEKRENVKRKRNVPLKQLNELPEETIEQIEPVFFPYGKWQLKDGDIYTLDRKTKDYVFKHKANEVEIIALEHFKTNMKLKQVAIEIAKDSEIPLNDIYQIVTSLFFKLVSLRICHPKKNYHLRNDVSINRSHLIVLIGLCALPTFLLTDRTYGANHKPVGLSC